ncbi:TRAP-type C4-dicarboxylate transport system, small permease component [Tritonibacter multivorans]|uniref:TRAP transporter small permease protein n=1 Tax=Tritonibacter multivorans TaxID=928856 RepID=A0A0N7LZL1_9RHOB|nr:TRAP transporter small permease [Tritonibacter multivorans]MDA7421752.1 TRAP transporter small permease [Tritonibacter multivorans]CUH77969.1 TRAP-type C4-dicarboxylate transport system, small permease component [Tritonibacter multivorans]SFD04636.1 TRAP-type mannitol/chloroaromatic compound transport system, small permease component [Tritonibacter multivorans]
MAGSSLVLSDDSRLSQIDRSLYRLEQVLALVSGLAVFSLMLMAVVSVGGRNFFNQPLPGYVDWIEQAMPLIAFMGIAYAQRDGGHIRMDMVVGALKGRVLYLVEFITTAVILLVVVLLVWGTWSHFDRSFDFAMPMWSTDSSIDIGLPIWPAKLLAPVAFSVLSLRLALQLWAYARAIVTPDRAPVAIPLIADAATQAAMEAEHVSGRDE